MWICLLGGTLEGEELPRMTDEQAEGLVNMALAGIDREYPNKPGQVMAGPEDVKSPRELHPVFYGHYDWHSSVHGHWMLLRMLRLFPDADFSAELRDLLDRRLSRDGLAAEAAYFRKKENRSFERMYGWAWALRLAAELKSSNDPQFQEWATRFEPLEKCLVERSLEFLPKLDWPIRCGFHPESSFALAQMLDYARVVKNMELEDLLKEKAIQFYGKDRSYPVLYEPSGFDFFSQGLNEADLMRRVLEGPAYLDWLDGFFPGLVKGELGNLLEPVLISDPEDAQLIHLAGLNLNRAWTMRGVLSALPEGDARRQILAASADRHERAGLASVHTGHYEGEHWLASFTVYLLGNSGH
ncbi:MAG: DUF2891 domain-containing protein [Haloferula sp.]